MTQRVAFGLAGTITAFVFVVMCGVVAMVLVYQFSPSAASVQANAQTSAANEVASNTLDGGQANAQPNAPVTSSQAIQLTPQQATTFAMNAAPRTRFTRAPELVLYNSALAYEFAYERGALYVDANTGAVMSNRDGERHDEGEEDDDD
ncbi:MAG: hypothetical protein HY868_05955 [Chloroflexi bacterium]|nr:hypothetical protein [Chloroflexota bacterium]